LCYRSGNYAKVYLDRVLKQLKLNQIENFEIILVGNYIEGQNDITPTIVKDLAEKNEQVNCLALPKKGWLGWDVRKGIQASKGEFIALIDGDGQMPAKDIIRVYEKIRNEDLDLVLTYRKKRGDGLYRFILSNTYNLITKVLFPGISFRDMNSKPKIIKRSSLNLLNLSVDNWTIDAEIMLQSWQKKLKIKEIATDFHGQPGGRKSFVGKSSIFQFILFLVRFRIRGH
jgi:glycosyltransferase involved in cell wall biosynthesis